MTKSKRIFSLTSRIVLAMFLGIIIGTAIKYLFPTSEFVKLYITDGLFYITGKIFIASLKMLVVPMVFISLVCGTCSLHDTTKLGRLGVKTLGLYILTTAFAVTLALLFAVFMNPGEGCNLQAIEATCCRLLFFQFSSEFL